MDIVRQRLHNSRLLQTELKTPEEVVSWLGALQAQDYAGAKWAIGLRTQGLTDAGVDHAFAAGSILRTHLLRPTWHFVTPADIRWMLALTAPRVHTLNAFMYRKLEVDSALIKKSSAIFEKLLRDRNYQTRDELAAALEKSRIQADGPRLAYIVMQAELEGLICSGPRKGKQFTYALLEERAPKARELTRAEALMELIKRYFQSHAPATLYDFCIWSGLTMADAKQGMALMQKEFSSMEIDGQTYWFTEAKPPKKKTPFAHLLPNYDEYFIGFKDRSAILRSIRQSEIRQDDPALLANVVFLNGQVVGGWKRILSRKDVQVEVSLIVKTDSHEKKAIETAAERFGEFMSLPILFTCKDYNHEQRTSRSF